MLTPGGWPWLARCFAKPVTRVSTLKSVNREGRDEGTGSMRARVRQGNNDREGEWRPFPPSPEHNPNAVSRAVIGESEHPLP